MRCLFTQGGAKNGQLVAVSQTGVVYYTR